MFANATLGVYLAVLDDLQLHREARAVDLSVVDVGATGTDLASVKLNIVSQGEEIALGRK